MMMTACDVAAITKPWDIQQRVCISGRRGVNSIWSIPVPHQIYQFHFQMYQFQFGFLLTLLPTTFYHEYLLRIPTPSSLYSK